MKIGIYTPYLDTAGGGEKYMLTIAEILSQKAEVDVLLDNHLASVWSDQIKERVRLLHGLDLSKVNFIKAPIGKKSGLLARLSFFKVYDWLFCLTDGSIFFSTAKNSILHFQAPFDNLGGRGLWGLIKIKSWNKAIFNSEFTKDYVEKRWAVRGLVVYPPVDIKFFKPSLKKKRIISVGRFAAHTKSKKHELMIDVFKQLVKEYKLNDWGLSLAGGVMDGDQNYLEELKKQADGFNISFYPDIALADLAKLYGESAIYWHAAGFGETDPEKMEHFGITTVEAMAAGCVPVVINLGGQKETVENGFCGYLWDTIGDLRRMTFKVIDDDRLQQQLSQAAQARAKQFSKERFSEDILKLVYGS